MENCKISQDDLWFMNEFRATYKPEAITEIVLVDHNILDVTQSDLGSKVTRIIDHHLDAKAYTDQLVEKKCRLIGSACSLVALKIAEDAAELLKDDLAASEDAPNFAYLLAAAVVLDSYYFKEDLKDKKWTQEDTDAHNFLLKTADVGKEYWTALNNAKFNVQAGLQLGLRGIFIRDYKNYDLASGVMGVAVSTGSIDTMITHFGIDKFAEACEAITQERNLGLFVIMSIEYSDDGNLKKGWLAHKSKNSTQELTGKYEGLINLVANFEDFNLTNKRELLLEATGNHATYFDIGNLKYSRKAYEAIVKNNPF